MIDRAATPGTESAFRPAMALVSGRTVGFAISFLIPVILARVLDQSDFGVYKQFFLIAATLYGIGQLGMAESLYYFIPRDPERAGRYLGNATVALGAGGLACLAGLVIWGDELFSSVEHPSLGPASLILGAYLFLSIGSAALEIAMIARKRYALASRTYAALDALRAALLIGPALVTGDLRGVLAGALVFAAIRFAITATYLGAAFKGSLRPDPPLFATQVAYAAPFALAGLIEIVQANFHQYYVAYHVDAATFAIYAVGCLQIPLVEVITTSVLNVTMVRMSEEHGAGRPRAAVAIWHDSMRKLALIFFPLAGFLLVAAPSIIVLLFTERYAASVSVFMAWTLALLIPVLGVDAVLRVHADTRVLFALNVVRLAVTVALVAPLVSAFGLVGAVLATVIAAAMAKALGLVRIGHVLHLGSRRLLPWGSLARILAAAAVAAGVAAAVGAEMSAGPLWSLVSAAVVYGPVYVLAVWILGGLTEPERIAIKARVARHVLATSGTGR